MPNESNDVWNESASEYVCLTATSRFEFGIPGRMASGGHAGLWHLQTSVKSTKHTELFNMDMDATSCS
ncbi:hypothetical protein J1614_004385 [Plenodomus biglobosus]|nr:hypothetical protein J1614_004385 [Plenodomus biglobosus]